MRRSHSEPGVASRRAAHRLYSRAAWTFCLRWTSAQGWSLRFQFDTISSPLTNARLLQWDRFLDLSDVIGRTKNMGALSGRVVVVTGASRGIGKGIAETLAGEGATVYVTGRTLTAGAHPLPGTIGETAAACDARGGKGIPVALDLMDSAQIADLFARVKREQGRLDILVNSAMAIPPEMMQRVGFWEKPLTE